jgi:hypothetical protein
MPKKYIHFEFNQELVKEPLLYHLNRKFAVVVNIRGASVSAEGGFVALELEGSQAEIDKVLEYLRGRKIEVVEGVPKAEEQ